MALSEHQVRNQKRDDLIKMNIVPYAPRFKKIQNLQQCNESCESRNSLGLLRDINDIIAQPQREISTAGRLTLFRSHGKISFGKLMDESGEIQIMIHRDNCKLLKNRAPHKVNQEYQQLSPEQKQLWRHIVKMVIVDDAGKIACNYVSSSGNYSLPGGGVNEGDNYFDAVHREAKEETGCEVKILYELPKIHEYLKKRDRHQLAYGYLCKTVGEKGVPQFIESEILDGFEIRWVDIEEFENNLKLQIENPDKDSEWEMLDGIFKRDLIILQSAKELLNKNKEAGNHEGYNTITEIQDQLTDTEGNSIEPYKFFEKYIDVGDFVGVKGELFVTHKGEATLFVSEFQLLSKALLPLGDKFHGIGENEEKAYRQRYLDMIFNRETLERMKLRSKFLKVIRNFYDEQGFIELNTGILGNFASGAAAAPFITHHNDFDIDMYLRISAEPRLKMATVGGLEKIFEVCIDFRNEGSDPSHHQEFTMIEHYAAYRDYVMNMEFTEKMFDYIFNNIPEIKRVISIPDKEGNIREVDFNTPWKRIDFVAQIKKDSGIDVSQYGSEDEESLRTMIKSKGYDWVGLNVQTTATMIDYLYKKVSRPGIVGPAFIYNYPKTMQPLARQDDANPKMVQQWQLLINGWEVIKAYSELVDPVIQERNFEEQSGAVAKGDTEATKSDEEFLLAMQYGMPPQSGWGMGIDRIFSLLTGCSNIRDVIMFPLVKPEIPVQNGQE